MAGLRGKALIAYLLVCTVWGSTYLAIRIGVGHLPPFLFAGVRFLVAGLLLGGLAMLAGVRFPTRARDWGTLAITGVFLLMGGNAVVVWSEQYVASGMASVFVAAMPLWMAFFDALVPGGQTLLTWRLGAGLALGFLGTIVGRKLLDRTPGPRFALAFKIVLTLLALKIVLDGWRAWPL